MEKSDKKIVGKTKLQKEMYFISLLLKMNFGYKSHYYGPYSPDVEDALDELIGAGFIRTEENIFGIDENGYEVKRFDYMLDKDGEKIANVLKSKNNKDYKVIANFVDKLKAMNNPDYNALSLAAKSYYILNDEGGKIKTSHIKRKAKNFGWNIKDEDVNMAIEILEKMDFVKIN
jgi:uncharacterized protein YwgA